jgi:hypothetical protein
LAGVHRRHFDHIFSPETKDRPKGCEHFVFIQYRRDHVLICRIGEWTGRPVCAGTEAEGSEKGRTDI